LDTDTASLILAAGRGSRMKGFSGNKTLLPLIPGKSHYEGSNPILLEIIKNLPNGPKAVVVNHRKKDIIMATRDSGLTYCDQPILNGTGGALLAARKFLKGLKSRQLIITMGDVPLVRKTSYLSLVKSLQNNSLSVLGFRPNEKKQYGVLEIEGEQVKKITEWKYWKAYSQEKQKQLQLCNSGIYAANTDNLLLYISILAARPHIVQKEIRGKQTAVEEFFMTDLVEYMSEDGLTIGYVIGEEDEVMGVDDLPAIIKAQTLFSQAGNNSRTIARIL